MKLEWFNDKYGCPRASFLFNGNPLVVVCYEGLHECNLYNGGIDASDNSGNENRTLGFPQNTKIESLEHGKQICQEFIDKLFATQLNEKQKKVLDVLEKIWSGETLLKWEEERIERETRTDSRYSAKFRYKKCNMRFQTYCSFKELGIVEEDLLTQKETDKMHTWFTQDENHCIPVEDKQKQKDYCQNFYNKLLLDEAVNDTA